MEERKEKILITGGCGYVGSRCAFRLNEMGYEVIVADKVRPEERNLIFPDSVEFRHGDLRLADKAEAAVLGADIILHLAANIGSLTYMHKYQADIIQENSAIDATIYPAAMKGGVKKIVYSSSSMVFQNSTVFPYKESDLDKVYFPTNVYGLSKLVGEYFCRAYHNQYGLDYVIIRYHNIYGPGEDSKGEDPGDIHVIPALLQKVVNGQYPLELLGNPEATRPFTYVDDAVNATIMIVEKAIQGDPNVINNDFNIGTDGAITVLNLAEIIWKLVGDGRSFQYEVVPTKAITALRREMNPEKIKSLIGWEPKISLEEGILKTADWIKHRKERGFSLF